MKKLMVLLLGLSAAVLVQAQERKKFIDNEMIDGFRRNAESVSDKRFLDEDMLVLSLDRALVESYDTVCTYRVSHNEVTDQMQSGRCWFFSTLNILRDEMIRRYDMGHFEFSQTYGQFWDLLEKSNRFLENVIDNRKKPMDSRMNEWLFKKPMGDGGHLVNAAHIISKYGIVPQEIMPERHSSVDNKRLMIVLRTVLRKYGLELRKATRTEIQTVKEAALTDIYRILVHNLGEPPAEFVWTLRDRNGNAISEKKYTPESFAQEFILHDMEKDYVIFMDDPTKPYYRMYTVDNSRNCYEYDNWTFLNLPAEKLLEMGVESLKSGRMFYFSADTDAIALMTEGIYDLDLYNLDEMMGVKMDMSKEEMILSCEIKSVHAMAMAGVQLAEDGAPVKWLVENSFGTVRGWDGYVVMQDEWLETFLFRMAVERQFVPEDILPLLGRKPKVLKSWNPTY